jgi:hypothetical protein
MINMREGKVWKEWNYDGWCHLAGIFRISFEFSVMDAFYV